MNDNSLIFSRKWAMPNHNTFDILPIGNFVKWYLEKSKVSIDPFARNKRWATYTNDLNPNTKAEYHMDAIDFLTMLKEKQIEADLVVFDPPYSPRQVKEVYEKIGKHFGVKDQQNTGRWTEEKRLIASMMRPGGIVLSFGWNTHGMGIQYNFEAIEILIIDHGGAHNATLCMAERRIIEQIELTPPRERE